MAAEYSADAIRAYITEQYEDQAPAVIGQVGRWLARGDGIAVYENHDLGHPEAGMPKIVSYGSPAAQLETDTPPARLPDGLPAGAINWRFVLVGTYRGAQLT